MDSVKDIRTPIAFVVGTILGLLTAWCAQNLMLAGILVIVAGSVFNALVVSLIAKRMLIFLSVISVLSCEIGLLAFACCFDTKYEDLNLLASIQRRFSISLVFVQLFPAVIVSSLVCAVRDKPV